MVKSQLLLVLLIFENIAYSANSSEFFALGGMGSAYKQPLPLIITSHDGAATFINNTMIDPPSDGVVLYGISCVGNNEDPICAAVGSTDNSLVKPTKAIIAMRNRGSTSWQLVNLPAEEATKFTKVSCTNYGLMQIKHFALLYKTIIFITNHLLQ